MLLETIICILVTFQFYANTVAVFNIFIITKEHISKKKKHLCALKKYFEDITYVLLHISQ